MKNFLRYSIGIILALIFLYFAFKGINFSDLMDSLKNANYFWLLLFFIVSIISHVVRSWRWQYLINHIKEKISLRNLFSSVMIGYMVNNFIPRGGEIARPYAIGKLENISISSALATVIVERVIDVLTLMLLIISILLIYQTEIIKNFPWLNVATMIAIIISFTGIIFIAFLSIKTEKASLFIQKFTTFLPKKISKKVGSLLRSFLEGLLIIKDPKNYIRIIILTIVLWFLYSLQWFLPFYSFGIVENYSLNFSSAVILCTILAIGIMIPVPGNTGTFHAFCIQALTGLFYVNKSIAAAYATTTHAIGLIGITIVGLYFFIKDNMKLSSITKSDS